MAAIGFALARPSTGGARGHLVVGDRARRRRPRCRPRRDRRRRQHADGHPGRAECLRRGGHHRHRAMLLFGVVDLDTIEGGHHATARRRLVVVRPVPRAGRSRDRRPRCGRSTGSPIRCVRRGRTPEAGNCGPCSCSGEPPNRPRIPRPLRGSGHTAEEGRPPSVRRHQPPSRPGNTAQWVGPTCGGGHSRRASPAVRRRGQEQPQGCRGTWQSGWGPPRNTAPYHTSGSWLGASARVVGGEEADQRPVHGVCIGLLELGRLQELPLAVVGDVRTLGDHRRHLGVVEDAVVLAAGSWAEPGLGAHERRCRPSRPRTGSTLGGAPRP